MKLYGVAMPGRRKICKSAHGERWACGQQSFVALRDLIGAGPVACEFKDGGTIAVCRVEGVDVSRRLLEEGWAELADDVTDKTYVNAAKLGKEGLWSR